MTSPGFTVTPAHTIGSLSETESRMSWKNKVIWSEGLFLRPQHFQQQERYFEQGDIWRVFCSADLDRALRGLKREADDDQAHGQ